MTSEITAKWVEICSEKIRDHGWTCHYMRLSKTHIMVKNVCFAGGECMSIEIKTIPKEVSDD